MGTIELKTNKKENGIGRKEINLYYDITKEYICFDLRNLPFWNKLRISFAILRNKEVRIMGKGVYNFGKGGQNGNKEK